MVAGTEFELDARASQAVKSVRTRTVAEIELLMRKTLIIYLLKVSNLNLNSLYKFDFDVLVFS